jgi:lambda family phage minor tail protein L
MSIETTIPVTELQNLENISIIELFELKLVSGLHYSETNANPTISYKFHNGTNGISTDIRWQGETYTAVACDIEGFETGDNTVMARPTITFANAISNLSTILELVNQITPFNDLQKAEVIRKRTMARFLDAENFTDNINPFGSPDRSKELEPHHYQINKKVVENNEICSFELVNTIDFEDLFLPRKQVTKDRFPACGTFVFV